MRSTLIVSAFLGFSLIQCSKTEPAGPKYPDSASFCEGWAQAECSDTVVRNCSATSKDLCISNRVTACTAKLVTPALQQGYTYNSGQAEPCVDQVTSAFSDAQVSAGEEQAITAACNLVFGGSRTQGSTCSFDADCMQGEGLRCVTHAASQTGTDAGAVEGTCQVPVSVSNGESCSRPDAQCADGFYCSSFSYCIADNSTIGDACGPGQPCATGLNCVAGLCAEKLANGVTCSLDSDCSGGICLEGSAICGSIEILAPNEPFCLPMHQ